MVHKRYRYTLKEMYLLTDDLYNKIHEEVSVIRRGFYIADMFDITQELIINTCNRYIVQKQASELTTEELYNTAITFAFQYAMKSYRAEFGVHFLYYWFKVMNRVFNKEWLRLRTQKEKFNHSLYSLNEFDSVGDFTEELVNNDFIYKCIDEFTKQDKYGELIKSELNGTREERRKAKIDFLGATEYGSRERKIVQRTKQRFAEYLKGRIYYL